ncbi:unnamed protein product, partial [Allacma fusca]
QNYCDGDLVGSRADNCAVCTIFTLHRKKSLPDTW